MINPIISADEAQRLNLLFQQKVDPRLFLFCNYEPTIPRPISEDGAFYVNVQDLYKFAIDSGCIAKGYSRYLADNHDPNFRSMGEILEQIKTLRSIVDHNQNEINGKNDKEMLSGYHRWMIEVIGKDFPESTQDFQSINRKLKSMATSLLSYLEKFVNAVGSAPNKQALVNQMIDHIMYWYSNNTQTHIYEGQLQDAYLYRASAAGKSYVSRKPARVLRTKVGKWIEAAQLFVYTQKQDELTRQKTGIQGSFSQVGAPNNPFSSLISEEDRKKLLTNLNQQLEKCEQEIEENEKKLDACRTKIDGKPYAYLFKILPSQLKETMDRLDKQGVPYTLLPQDLMQEDIEYRFAGVASPEYDF